MQSACFFFVLMKTLTFNVSKRAENTTWTVSGLLNVVALGTFVDLRMELLLCASVTIATLVAGFAIARLAPFFAVFHTRAWGRSETTSISTNCCNNDMFVLHTYIYISWDYDACPCYYDTEDTRILGGTT